MRLIDETAILACAAYVDLNPIRAAMAETIEESDFTSAQKRAAGLKSRVGAASTVRCADQKPNAKRQKKVGGAFGGQCSPNAGDDSRSAQRTLLSGRHLAPVGLKERTTLPGPNANKRGTRCSNKGFLPMSTADYLSLLDWTARETRSGTRGSTPRGLEPIFERLGISASVWLGLVQNFGRLFSVVAGQPQQVDEFRSKAREHRYHLRKDARELMTTV